MPGTTPVLAFAARQAANAKERSLQILIYDVIGDDGWGAGFTAQQLRQELKEAGDVDVINVRINSPGGMTPDGFAIFNALKDHPARVEIDIDGDASSMASVIAQAGDVRRMASNAEMMVHEAKAPTLAMLTATRARSIAEHLDVVNGNIVQVYASTTKQDETQLREWMAAETFMSAATAKKRGFVDRVTTAGGKAASVAWAGHPGLVQARAGGTNEQQELPLVASANEPKPQGSGAVPRTEGSDMETTQIALALGLGADADEASILKACSDKTTALAHGATAAAGLTTLLGAIGADSVEAGVGAIEAGKAALAQNETLAQRVEAIEQAEKEAKRTAAIARIKTAGKCTPSQETDLFPKLDISGLLAFEKTAVRLIGKTGHTEPGSAGAGTCARTTGDLTFNGKAWSEMTFAEKHDLKHADAELYAAMRKDGMQHTTGAR